MAHSTSMGEEPSHDASIQTTENHIGGPDNGGPDSGPDEEETKTSGSSKKALRGSYKQVLQMRNLALESQGKGPKHRGFGAKNRTEDGVKVEPDIKTCGVCKKEPRKYKCPRPGCSLQYCSVACNKIHRENHQPDPKPDSATSPSSSSLPPPPPVSDLTKTIFKTPTGKQNPFRLLEESPHLQYLFKKYPRLPQLLSDIHAATESPANDPMSRIPASMKKDLPGQSGRDEWNREKAIASGKEALRKARSKEGLDGEAIREYSELVLYIMQETDYKTGNRR